MLDAVGELFPYAVGVALSPLPLIAVLLLLLMPSGRASGAALLVGRWAAVVVIATTAALLAEQLPESDGSSVLVAVLRIVLGVGLMVLAIRKWSGRPTGQAEAELPGWMASVESSSVGRAAWLGVLLSVANLKELAFGVGAGLIIGSAGLEVGATVLTVAIYAAIACLSVSVPVVALWVGGDRVRQPLENARTWLVRNNTTVMALVLLVLGAILIGNGITAL